MKKTTTLISATALVGATLLIAGPAVAAPSDWTAYSSSDIGIESGSYPAYPATNAWFLGADAHPDPTFSDAYGLTFTQTGGSGQLLNHNQGALPTFTSATQLRAAIDAVNITTSDDSAWAFQLPLFANVDSAGDPMGGSGAAGGQFTTLRPAANGNPDSTGQWTTSGRIYNSDGTEAFAPGSTASLSALLTPMFDATRDFRLLAFGLWTNADITLYTAEGFGTKSKFYAATPTVTVSPTAGEIGDDIVVTGSGLIPGTLATGTIFECDTETSVGTISVEVANNGTFVHTIDSSDYEAGEYCVQVQNSSLFSDFWETMTPTFELTEPRPELAATGTEATGGLIAGAAALVLGLGALLLAKRRAGASS